MEFNVIIEKDEDGWLVSEAVGLQGCHTQAKTMDELIKRTREAIQLCLESEQDSTITAKFIGIQKIEV